MNSKTPSLESSDEHRIRPLLSLWIGGSCLFLLTLGLAWLAQSFPYEKQPDRPIVEVVWLSWLASLVAIATLYFGLKIRGKTKQIRWLIVSFAIGFRLVLVFSNPILEVDYYRYLWDGIAANQGVSPYKFSPQAVLEGVSSDSELSQLQDYIAENPSAHTIVSRVHFEQFTTLYPPVSQFVFRSATALIPDHASVYWHIALLKLTLVLFDISVIGVLLWILATLGKHPAWALAYAWNPLVLKEIANGGHLDSVAIFFMTAGIGVFLWIVRKIETAKKESKSNEKHTAKTLQTFPTVASGALMALGIGGKLFPVIFLPAMTLFLWARGARKQSIVFAMACTSFTALVMWPMLTPANQAKDVSFPNIESAQQLDPDKPHDGLTVFLTNWRMNDAIFSGIYQNVEYDWHENGPAWYVIVPNETRIQWCRQLEDIKLANGNAPYFVARLITVVMFGLFYLWILFRIWKTESADEVANLLFLTMGVFFFLQPTQNPWYWLWAMPLVCFAKNRGWLFVSMILFVYYLRFWFTEKEQAYQFLGTTYVGQDFFDHCLVWVEFAVVIFILMVAPMIQRLIKRGD